VADFPDGFGPGWEDMPQEVEAVQKILHIPSFGMSPADEIPFSDIPDEVLGHKVYERATGHPWKDRNQASVGSCVAFGTAAAIEFTQAVETLNGDGEEPRPISREVLYGGSRHEVGGGRLRGDGSVGAWAADFALRYGSIDEETIGAYSVQRCREYGARGVPEAVERQCARHKVGETTLVTSFEEACKSMASGYFIACCSNQGFGMVRDREGFASPRGSWAHCMAMVGYRKTGRAGILILNSWGGETTTGPTPGDIPKSSWWCEASVADAMLRKGRDSWAFSQFAGFPARKLNRLI